MSSRSTLLLLALPLACASPAPADGDGSSGTTTDISETTAASSSGTSEAPTTGEHTGTPDEPPETALLVHSFGAHDLGPLQETEPCAQWTLHNEQPLYVNTVTLSNDGVYHHSNWLVVPDDLLRGRTCPTTPRP